ADPPGIVAPDLVVRAARLHRDRREREPAAARDCGGSGTAGGGDRFGARRRLVLVAEVAVRLLLRQLLLHLFGRELGVEEMEHDLGTDRAAELGEHALALAGVLDERIL